MASLTRILSTRSSGDAGTSSSSSHRTLRVKNSQEITMRDVEKELCNWDIPRVPITDIYYKGSFKFRSDYAIKTVEKTISVIHKNDSF